MMIGIPLTAVAAGGNGGVVAGPRVSPATRRCSRGGFLLQKPL